MKKRLPLHLLSNRHLLLYITQRGVRRKPYSPLLIQINGNFKQNIKAKQRRRQHLDVSRGQEEQDHRDVAVYCLPLRKGHQRERRHAAN